MNNDELQEACRRVSAEAKAQQDAHREAIRAKEAANEVWLAARRTEEECAAVAMRSFRTSSIANRLADGACADHVNNTYRICVKPAKSACKECGGQFCAAHVKSGKHDCQEWRRIARDVLGIAEKEAATATA